MNRIGTFCALLSLLCISSCSGPSVFRTGSGGGTPPGGGGGTNGEISIALTSALTPIPGITVLSFDVSVVGLTLTPTTGSLVVLRDTRSAQRVELTHLQTDSISMGSFPIFSGTYTTLTASFLPLNMTIFNQTGGTLQTGSGGSCLNNTVCAISPTSAGTITITNTAPFPFVIASAQQTGLQLTVDIGNLIKLVNNALSLDFTRPGILSVTKLLLPAPGGQLITFDDQIGRVTALDLTAKTFTFQSQRAIFTVSIDTTTTTPTVFDGFSSCPAADITCLKNDQSVSVDAGLKGDGTSVAREIQLEDQVFDEEFEGTIFSVDSPTQFEVVPTVIILGNSDILANARIDVGTPVIVQLQLNPKFEADTKGFRSQIPVPSLGSFENANDTSQLRAGQEVEVRVKAEGTRTTFPVILTDRVRLRFTKVTGIMSTAVAGQFFNIQGLPPLFGPFGSTGAAQVQFFPTGARVTTIENAPTGLNNGDLIAMRALFIKSSAPPFFATKIRKR